MTTGGKLFASVALGMLVGILAGFWFATSITFLDLSVPQISQHMEKRTRGDAPCAFKARAMCRASGVTRMKLMDDVEEFFDDDVLPGLKAFLQDIEPTQLQIATKLGAQAIADAPELLTSSSPLTAATNIAKQIGTLAVQQEQTVGLQEAMVAGSQIVTQALAKATQQQPATQQAS